MGDLSFQGLDHIQDLTPSITLPFYHSGPLLTLIDSFSLIVKVIQAQPEGKSLCYIITILILSLPITYKILKWLVSLCWIYFLITYVLSAVEIWFPLSLIYRNCTLEGHPWFSNHQIQRILFYFSSLLFNQLNYLFLQILNSMMLFCPDFVCILG